MQCRAVKPKGVKLQNDGRLRGRLRRLQAEPPASGPTRRRRWVQGASSDGGTEHDGIIQTAGEHAGLHAGVVPFAGCPRLPTTAAAIGELW